MQGCTMENEATLAELGEFGLIDRVNSDQQLPDAVLVGPGDDCAVVRVPDGRSCVTVDLLIEGKHFKTEWSTPVDIGRKAAAASLADIVSMGAAPTYLVVGFGAPASLPVAWALACIAGLRAEAAALGAVVVGGDITAADAITISVTALGELDGREPVLRSGAQPGDVLALAGRVGWSAAGLAVLSRGFRSPKVLVDAHRAPEPPYESGVQAANAGATSMIDVSDGLIADVRHLAEASGVAMNIETSAFEVPEALNSAAAAYNVDPLEWMLTGGEDHALVATFRPDAKLPKGWRVIGSVSAGEPRVTVNSAPIKKTGGHEHWK